MDNWKSQKIDVQCKVPTLEYWMKNNCHTNMLIILAQLPSWLKGAQTKTTLGKEYGNRLPGMFLLTLVEIIRKTILHSQTADDAGYSI